MGMTVLRWGAGVTLGCAAVAVTLLPFPSGVDRSWAGPTSAPLAAEVGRLAGEIRLASDAVRTYRSAVGLSRWKTASAGGDTTAIRVERTVPNAVAVAARVIATEQWKALGKASAAYGEVFIYVDTTTIPRARVAEGSRRPIESRAMIDVSFALPEATDGTRCVALVRLRGVSASHIEALRRQSLVGVCGFFAAFGTPGVNVTRWLAETGYRFARRSDWHVARAPAIDVTAKYALSDNGGRCLTGEHSACLDALLIRTVPATSSVQRDPAPVLMIDGVSSPSSAVGHSSAFSLGDAEGGFLADVVRAAGPERFATFWTARGAPDAAFANAVGTNLGEWTHGWTTRSYGTVSRRPTVRARDVVWLALAMPLLLVVTARPREWLLAQPARRLRRD